MIPEEEVAQVRSATDIVGLIGEHTALRQQGRRWSGLCPFHTEKSPSFSVNAQEGLYYCFGCQASGDAISFVRATEHVDFAEAVRLLADRAGITLHEDRDTSGERKRRTELLEAMERAAQWYHERLLRSPDAGRAREYLRSRGYDGDVVRQFRLGWAPDDWDALCKHLKLPERVLSITGLGFVNRRGRLQDSFRARILFPICDPSGHPVAFGGRILPGAPTSPDRASEPKYKNSQETPIYSKRRILYGLNWAKRNVIDTDEVVVCEGYTDVIGFFRAGVPRAVATCGTALAEEHFTLLRSFAKRIVLAYDADAAGQSATTRVYEWERRHQVDVAVVDLPAGSDPGELAESDPALLVRAVAEARPFLQFRVDRVLSSADLSTAEGRAKAAEAAIDAVAEHPDDLVRDQYVMQVADRTRLEPQRVRERLDEARRRAAQAGRPASARGDERGERERGGERRAEYDDDRRGDWEAPAPPPRRAAPNRPGSRAGLEALRLAVHRPAAVADRLEEILFPDDLQRRTFRTLSAATSLPQAVDDAEPDVADLLRRLAVEELVPTDDNLGDPVDAVVAQLVREAARQALAELQAEARASGEGRPDLLVESGQVRLLLDDLDRPDRCREAADRLVAWLLGRAEES